MANGLISAGATVKWAAEATAGTRPTSGYATLAGVTAVPAINQDANVKQTTPINQTVNHTYTRGLADPGAIGLTVNDFDAFRAGFSAMKTAYDALDGGKQMWVELAYPPEADLNSFYMPVEVTELGFGGFEVDEVMENTVNLIPAGAMVEAAASA